ncbi:MAG TPA: hypothetical protein VNI57_07255, partial [Candidatus Saccharimonadales bacterium]|nr:hypothetical protein [Candidatus Saccharimonadales bacterium]
MTPKPRGGSRSPLSRLQVIDRLEVGPPVLTPKSLSTPYRVVRGKRSETIEFAYRYEEQVFDPADPEAASLASVMGAQVALNYGIPCKEIVFSGSFDERDRRFIEEMTENTSREIYVKKLLEPNPFLRGDAVGLPAVRMASYTQARLRS